MTVNDASGPAGSDERERKLIEDARRQAAQAQIIVGATTLPVPGGAVAKADDLPSPRRDSFPGYEIIRELHQASSMINNL